MKKFTLCGAGGLLLCGSLVFAQPLRAPRTAPPKIRVETLEVPNATVRESLSHLLIAVENNDYERFVAGLSLNFRAHMDEILFKKIYESLGPRMGQGYHVIYMGELNKAGFKTYIFKFVFKDGRDQVLATISFYTDGEGKIIEDPKLKDEGRLKTAGFYLH